MKYVSTRGKAHAASFKEVVFAGLASDGGLYLPEFWPQISADDIAGFAHQPYIKTAASVMQKFIGDSLSQVDLNSVLQTAYGSFNVSGGTDDMMPLIRMEDNFHVLELFHGSTLAFKDVAMQFLGSLFGCFLQQHSRRVTIVGATSGDTGSAAISAFENMKGVDVFILHPKDRVSEVQRRQMTTVTADNVHNIAIEGSFDDCQNIVKSMFADVSFRQEVGLSGVNSINWARILAQAVYYMAVSAKLYAKTGKKVTFSIPSGNFGNAYAGYVAKMMSAPIDKLLVATNANDILHRFFTTGKMRQEEVVPTLSPSMDIQVASNFERLLFDICMRSGDAVARTMHHFSGANPYDLDDDVMVKINETFISGRKDDAEITQIMHRVWEEKKYLIDPHTAVGMGVAYDFKDKNPDAVIVSLATAHPAKFPDAVINATGERPVLPAHMGDLYSNAERFSVLPPDLNEVQGFIRKNRS